MDFFSLPQQHFWYNILGTKKVSQPNQNVLLYCICEIDMLLTNCKAPIILIFFIFCFKFKIERIIETFLNFQSNHEHPRARRVHHLSGAASDVWWHEAGRGGYGALHHSPLLKPQEPHSPTWSHLPGHAAESVPSQVLSSADQRVSSPFHVCVTLALPWGCLFAEGGAGVVCLVGDHLLLSFLLSVPYLNRHY